MGGWITEIACWAHVRAASSTTLFAANGSPIAKEALERVGALYAVEADIRGRPPDERRLRRAGNYCEDLYFSGRPAQAV